VLLCEVVRSREGLSYAVWLGLSLVRRGDDKMINLRCSALPLLFSCGVSLQDPELPVYQYSGQAADLGTAVHGELARHVDGQDVEPSKATSFLFWAGVKAWRELAPEFPAPLTEVLLDHGFEQWSCAGHVDVVSVVGSEIRILDWKSGFKDSDYREQMRGYCALALLKYPEIERATATIVWLRTGEIERYTMTREQVAGWRLEVMLLLNEPEEQPGTHCDYCRRSHECRSRNALVRRDIATVLDVGTEEAAEAIARMNPRDIVALLGKAKMIAACADRIKDAIKAHVETVGEVEGEKTKLTLAEVSRRNIDPLKAWPILTESGFEDSDFAECVKISASTVDAITSKKAGRGNGKRAIAALREKLEAAGAVSTTTIQKLTERRVS
jgi:hypothetical protein